MSGLKTWSIGASIYNNEISKFSKHGIEIVKFTTADINCNPARYKMSAFMINTLNNILPVSRTVIYQDSIIVQPKSDIFLCLIRAKHS